MAAVTIPTARYAARIEPYTFEAVPTVAETWAECELQPTDWQVGRTVEMRLEHSNDGGATWSHLVGGTWVGPQPGAFGNPYVFVNLLPPERRTFYRVRGYVRVNGGAIRTAVVLGTA